MNKLYKYFLKSFNMRSIHRQQGGQILIMAVILLFFSSLMIIPLAHHINTGIKTTQVYQRNTKELYAADRGIQYSMWKIKYDSTIVANRANNIYTTYGPYAVPAAVPADHNTVTVQISSYWLFYYLFRMPQGATPHNAALTTTSDPVNGIYTLTFTNNGQPLHIDKMGIWLPAGFKYNGSPSGITTDPPTITPTFGGTNITWDINYLHYAVPKNSTAVQRFSYTPANLSPKGAASWIFPQEQSIGASWDDAVWWYEVVSTAVDTSVSPNKTTTVHALVIWDPETVSGLNLATYIIGP
jgi:hypothetical protein